MAVQGFVGRLEDRLLQVFLVAAVVLSVLFNIIGLDPKWYLPAIFLALYGILRTVLEIGARATVLSTTFYRSNSEFYAATQRRMQKAKQHVWVTYVRTLPPPGFESAEAASYFDYGLKWAKNNPDRELRRIVGSSDSGPIADWLVQHRQETQNLKNYSVRVAPYIATVDDINIAIIDSEAVFLALTGDGNRMTGHSLQTPEAVQAFREYYLQKWEHSEQLAIFVDRVTSKNPQAGAHSERVNVEGASPDGVTAGGGQQGLGAHDHQRGGGTDEADVKPT